LQFWGPKAAIAAQYLKKGKELIVWGTVSTHAYLDKQGAPQAKLELTVTRFDFAGGRDDREDGGNAQQNDYDAPPPSNADDIPF
jgi:single-stranded DNA-binding protein